MNKRNENKNMAQTNPYYNNSNNNSMGNGQGMNNSQGMNTQNINNNQAIANQNPYISAKSGFSTSEILTGALVGAAATYILTNENVQKTLFKGALSITEILSGGLDEMKERFEDAKAEHEAAKEA